MYNKQVVFTKPKVQKITLNTFEGGVNNEREEQILNSAYARYSYNFEYSSGALKSGAGVDYMTILGKRFPFEKNVYPLNIYHYNRHDSITGENDERYIIYASDKNFYSLSVNKKEMIKIEGLSMDSAPVGLNYNYNGEDVYIFSKDGEGIVIINDTSFTDIVETPNISSMSMHSERLFITTKTDKKTLWFSDDFDPTNWQISLDKAGFIILEDGLGDMLKVLSFSGYLFVFRTYGITQLSAYGSQEDFYTTQIVFGHGKIYGDTVTDCGDYIVYLADDGLYRFNGVTSVKIMAEIDGSIVDGENAKCCFSGGKFYLSTKIKFENDKIEQGVIVYNIKEKQGYILRHMNILSFCGVSGNERKILCAVKGVNEIAMLDDSGKYFGKNLKKVWQSAMNDFGIISRRKRLDKISVETDGNITLVVKSDYASKLFVVNGSGRQTIYTNLFGSKFSFTFITYSGKPKIVKPVLYISYFEDWKCK